MNKALVFGLTGQDGYYLKRLLESKGIDVEGPSHSDQKYVNNFDFVESFIKKYQPDYLFHFSADSTTRHDALFVNHLAISTGTLNILENVRLHCPACKVLLAGSAIQFKNVGLPIDENTPFEANSPYAVARIQSVYAKRYYQNKFGLKIYIGYFFNHDSPLRTERHVNQKIAQAAKRIEQGSDEKLFLGNINVQKEFNFAGDIVEAMWTLVTQDDVFEAVIGCGIAYSIKNFVDCCFKLINKDWRDYVELESEFTPEYRILVSNPALIKSLGWKPKVNFQKLAIMMMEKK